MILRALKAAKPFLWDGRSPLLDKVEEYICDAMAMAVRHMPLGADEVAAARKVIMKRLKPAPSLDYWLHRQGVLWVNMSPERLQYHRHAWLDQLIEEFSK